MFFLYSLYAENIKKQCIFSQLIKLRYSMYVLVLNQTQFK